MERLPTLSAFDEERIVSFSTGLEICRWSIALPMIMVPIVTLEKGKRQYFHN
jgi:hypothetical protein